MSTPAQRVIEGAYKILSDEKRWTKDYAARDEHGNTVHPPDEGAHSFCVLGALERATGGGRRYDEVNELLNSEAKQYAGDFNDATTTTHADILALLRRAHKAAGDGGPEVLL